MKKVLIVISYLSCPFLYASDDGIATSEIIDQLSEVSSINSSLSGPANSYCLTIHKANPNLKTEFNKIRKISTFMEQCLKPLNIARPKSFEEAIKFAIDRNITPMTNNVNTYVSGLYGVKKWSQNVGLISHPMCELEDKKLFAGTSSKKKNRLKAISVKLLKIPKEFNKRRNKYLTAVKEKKPKAVQEKLLIELKNFYLSVMASIAEHESLSTVDKASSESLAKSISEHYGISGFKKPDGVKFYYDKYQSNSDSKRNIGMYQFSADPKANLAPCITAWNNQLGKLNSKCKIGSQTKKDTLLLLAASDQVFNAFCGMNKLVQSYGVQVNTQVYETTKRRRTHSQNRVNDKLKESKKRCVSLFTDSLNTYNHFGTLGFTTSTNTKEIVDSVLKSIE